MPSKHDTVWVIIDCLTKVAYFIPLQKDYKLTTLARLYVDNIVWLHGVLLQALILLEILDLHQGFWKALQQALRTEIH